VRRVLIDGVDAEPIVGFSETSYRFKGLWPILVVAAFAVLLSGLLAPKAHIFWELKRETAQLTDQIARQQSLAITKRGTLDTLKINDQNQSEFLNRTKFKVPTSQTLRELTTAVPDEIWLTRLSISDDLLVANGIAQGSAAEEVLKLSQRDGFGLVELRGSISKSASNGESFEFVLPLRNGGLD